MIGRLNHVAIAVRDIAKATAVYRDTLGAEVSAKVPQPEHGVSTVFVMLPNTKIEWTNRCSRGPACPAVARSAAGCLRQRGEIDRASNLVLPCAPPVIISGLRTGCPLAQSAAASLRIE